MRQLLLILSILLSTIPSFSQLVSTQNYNQVIERKISISHHVAPFGKKGLIVFGEIDSLSRYTSYDTYYFQKYDKGLDSLWYHTFSIDEDYQYTTFYQDSTDLYLLFYNYHKKKIALMQQDIKGNEILWREAKTPTYIKVDNFSVFGKNALIFGQINGFRGALDFSFFDQKIKAVPSFYKSKSTIQNTKVDQDEQELYLTLRHREKGKCRSLLKSLRSDGKLQHQYDYPSNIPLLDAHYFRLKNNQKVVVSTYGKKCSSYAQGFAIALLDPNKTTQDLRLTSFYDFEHYFEYLSDKQKKKYRQKKKNKQKDGKDWFVSQRFLLQHPIVTDDGFVIVAEGYSHYHEPNTTRPNDPNIQVRNPHKDVVKYKFGYTIVAAFDMEGRLLWDNAFLMNDDLIDDLNFQSETVLTGDTLVNVQLTLDHYRLAVIDKEKPVYYEEEIPYIQDFQPLTDHKRSDDTYYRQCGLSRWYGDYFIFWGVRFQNPKKIFAGKKVFQLSKVYFVKPDSDTK